MNTSSSRANPIASAVPYLCLFLILLTTNRLNYDRDIQAITAGWGDIISYRTIALAAPGLPTEPIFFHHSQRLFVPYLLGILGRVVPIDIDSLFFIAAIFTCVLIVFFIIRAMRLLGFSPYLQTLLLIFYICNPYSFRYYLMAPQMIIDIGFVLGFVLFLNGIIEKRWSMILIGLLYATLNRQTGLLLIPVFLLWVIWTGNIKKDLWKTIFAVVVPVAVYLVTSKIAAIFSRPSENLLSITGILDWAAHRFSLKVLLEFIIRGVIPFAAFAGLLAGSFRNLKDRLFQSPLSVVLLLFVPVICSQPFLGGPDFTGQSIARLDALALPALLLFTGTVLNSPAGKLSFGNFNFIDGLIFGLIAALGSIHHIYTYNGVLSSEKATHFAVIYFVLSAVLAFLSREKMAEVRNR